MSNALAIAATTAVLKNVLTAAVVRANLSILGDPNVSTVAPDRVPMGELETSRLNIFMYHATPNTGLRNVGLPAYDSQGRRISNPPLAIDLHYLLSAYGKPDFAPDILLGVGMQILFEIPVLTRDAIRRVFTPPINGSLSPELQKLATSGIAEQVEAIKITPHTLNSEEIFKLWSAFQIAYRPTAAYQVSVILIESRQSVTEALPVRQPKVYVLPFRQPTIEEVIPQILTYAANAKITLQGRNLLAENTIIRFGAGGEQAPDAENYTDTQLQVNLPSSLQAGVNTVQVIQQLNIGEPTLHEGFASNVAAFSLRPTLQKTVTPGGEVYDITVTQNAIIVKLNPLVGKAQQVVLLLNEFNPPTNRAALAYNFKASFRDLPDQPATTDTINITIQGVQPGNYLLRVRVDGAESLLDLDANNRPIAPQVSII
ncbi:DUF4255 domain-containing protein [Nostoc sp. UHCC 0702]|nr:DUF4255 domain-containing protein [Nostoc sp. UHCC 0702]